MNRGALQSESLYVAPSSTNYREKGHRYMYVSCLKSVPKSNNAITSNNSYQNETFVAVHNHSIKHLLLPHLNLNLTLDTTTPQKISDLLHAE